MIIVLIMIPYWLYHTITYMIDKDKKICLLTSVLALIFNIISYDILSSVVYVPFVNWLIVILLAVFFAIKVIANLKYKTKIIATVAFLSVCILGLKVLFSPYFNPFDIISDYDKKTINTKFGDKITFTYEEYNFPDLSCELTIEDSESQEPVYLWSDPPAHYIEIREILQVGDNNIYLSNCVFLIKNIKTKEFTKYEIEELIANDAFEAYAKTKDVIKVFVCSGNVDWVVNYAEPFVINGDTDVINTVVNIGNADKILSDEPNWTDVGSHINAMYEDQVEALCPVLFDKSKDYYHDYNAVEAEDAVIYCKELINKYNLKYIGENTIHDNCKY
ncbi:MAG: hypothetical protein E7392_02525 [Ruminococcaceae bacterium]|nr:hypothetical protein [Oscillospiraceae bacterium]